MPSAFGGLNMMGNALRIFQRALDVTGHNIANVNTVGYSRQRVVLGTNMPDTLYGLHPYQVGTGVNIQTVMRVRSLMLDTRMNRASADLGTYESLATTLKQIETVFPEPSSNGIGDALGKFFDSWSALASNSGDVALKMQVRAAGQTLAQRVRNAFSELLNQEQAITLQLGHSLDEIDGLTRQIATLNEQIVAESANGGSPNDLLDRRDLAVENLNRLLGVQTSIDPNGAMRVYAGEILLVDGASTKAVPRQFDATTQTLSDGINTYAVTNGQLAGLMQGLRQTESYKGHLDLLANTLRTQVNSLHMTGQLADGTTGILFFNDSTPQTGAADFALSAAIDASADNVVSGASGAIGDGGVALALSRLRETGITALGGKTFKNFYGDFVSAIGRDIQVAASSADTQRSIMEQVSLQRQSEMGVNLDEEMANLLQFQRSYQAAAKALTVLNEVTEDLVNMIR